ncbi:diguanylate phosphodiesterase [Candidatus Symbiopectobacterium sp. NZEC135]|uniref:diguanylate phosphodiesterase n=1 Tax=Candidatus Symbiopectobacterium sp. NZEC135 TaxID=2820471 RepID=UPI0022262E2C|nr:diguanylate phosphodiesterase [Candidatus Symbiopectobacterium sp. NZEC135]MCW2478005.1 diguanylate phosphodiesterase [Candidatus Symbiopectobacterium sp. NZEC135]
MLSTLIYRSRASRIFDPSLLDALVAQSQARNMTLQLTGILIFDGSHFLQILEGDPEAVNQVYDTICNDPRHDGVIELMRDYAAKRRFINMGMALFDLRHDKPGAVLRAVIKTGALRYNLVSDDRVYKFIRTFVEGRWKKQLAYSTEPESWGFLAEAPPFATPPEQSFLGQPCQFALQPIVEPLRGQISSFEALIRGPNGESPLDYFASIPPDKLHETDLSSKAWALALAKNINIGSHKISINLLPMSLVKVPNAVDILLEQIDRNGLVPEQVIVEVTEDEVISSFDAFSSAIQQLRSAGIGVAIDDFGAGFAGLSLLAKFQPGKIKIDRSIVTDIHAHGPKQAIVQAIVKCCAELEISVVAEGVETVEEWCWLEAAGIRRFQGFLFAKPKLNGAPAIYWPHRRG